MALPRAYKKPSDLKQRIRPSQEQLSRPIVDWRMMKIPIYKTDGIVNLMTGQADKKMRTVEVHPVEWDAQIVLAYEKSNVGDGLYVGNVLAVSTVTETTGRNLANQ